MEDIFNSMHQYCMDEASESAIGAGAFFGVLALGCAWIAWDNHRHAKKQKKIDAIAEEARKREVQSREKYIDAAKRLYGIVIDPYPADRFPNKAAIVKQIRADVTKWVTAIKRSNLCKQLLENICKDDTDEAVEWVAKADFNTTTLTPALLLSAIKVEEGVNGWDESIQLIDGSQDLCLMLAAICEEVSMLINAQYQNCGVSAGFGDGDEGHVYYTIKDVSAAQEGIIGAAADVIVPLAGAAVVGGVMLRRQHKREEKEQQERDAKEKAENAEHAKRQNENWLASVKKGYGITLTPYSEGSFKNQTALVNQIRKDVSTWVAAMKRSSTLKQYLQKLIDNDRGQYVNDILEDHFPGSQTLTPTMLMRFIVANEGVSGWQENIQIIDGGQETCLFLNDITDEIAQMLNVQFAAYGIGADIGDGDEGHVYYNTSHYFKRKSN